MRKQYLSEDFNSLVLSATLKDAIGTVTTKQKSCGESDWVELSELDRLMKKKIRIESNFYRIPEKYREEVSREAGFRSYTMYSIIKPELVNYQLYYDIILEYSNKYPPKKIWYKVLVEKIKGYFKPSQFRMQF